MVNSRLSKGWMDKLNIDGSKPREPSVTILMISVSSKNGFQSKQLGNILHQRDHTVNRGNQLPIKCSTVPSYFPIPSRQLWIWPGVSMDVDMHHRQPAIVDGFGTHVSDWFFTSCWFVDPFWLNNLLNTTTGSDRHIHCGLRPSDCSPHCVPLLSTNRRWCSAAEKHCRLHNPMPWSWISGLFLLVGCG